MTVADFFQFYAEQLHQGKTDKLAEYYSVPYMDMCGDDKTVIHDNLSLSEHIEALRAELIVSAECQLAPEVQTQMRLADDMMFCTVRWRRINGSTAVGRDFPFSYTIKLEAEQVKYILTTVRENLSA